MGLFDKKQALDTISALEEEFSPSTPDTDGFRIESIREAEKYFGKDYVEKAMPNTMAWLNITKVTK